MSQKAEIKFEFTGNISAFVKELKANFNDLNVQVNQVDNTSTTTFNSMRQQLNTISFVSLNQGLQNFRNTLQSIIGPATGFEQIVADVSAGSGIAGENLEFLAKSARKAGKESGLGAVEAMKGYDALTSLMASRLDDIGMDGLEEMHKQATTLAMATGMDMTQAAEAVAKSLNRFNMGAADSARAANVLAVSTANSEVSMNDLLTIFERLGPRANTLGVEFEELSAMSSVLAKSGIEGRYAYRDLDNIMSQLQNKLGFDLSKTPMSEALKSLQGEVDNTDFLISVFGENSLAAARHLITNADAVSELNHQYREGTQVQEMAAIRTDTYAQSLARINAWFDDIKISIFNYTGSVLPAVEITFGFMQAVSTVVPALKMLGSIVNWVRKSKMAMAVWTKIVTAAQWLWNAAMTANPIGIIIVAVGALVGAIVWLTGNIQTVIEWLGQFGHWLLLLAGPFGFIAALIIEFWDEIRAFFTRIGHAVLDFIDGIIPGFKDSFMQFWEWLKGWIKRITDTIVGWWNSIKSFLGFGKKETIEIEAELKYPDEMEDQGYSTEAVVEPRRQFGFETETPAQATGGRGISESLNQVSGSSAGSQVRNNNISIENLVRDINIHHSGNMPALMEKIRAAVAEALIGAVRDTELAIS